MIIARVYKTQSNAYYGFRITNGSNDGYDDFLYF